ncbi:protein of unknown function [Legionella micdadei]|uniref:Uncharacterized protein n=1 Tax=Legionella micdadei TaxID=451 RepID=A0A098GLE6_LEGMI|nr:protein of unknown function [Legionella micdadei]
MSLVSFSRHESANKLQMLDFNFDIGKPDIQRLIRVLVVQGEKPYISGCREQVMARRYFKVAR